MNAAKNFFIIDIPNVILNTVVQLTGIVDAKKSFQNGRVGVTLKDITGKILCVLDKSAGFPKVNVDDRVRVAGEVTLNTKNVRILTAVNELEVLGNLKSDISELARLDSEMREQASRMLMNRICRKASSFLQGNHFIEFESKLISNRWPDDSLEPLLVSYPGFGSPVVLTTSSASQVTDFLTTTVTSKAFTISTSFTSSYRFPNGSAEMRVIVAKATDLSLAEQEALLLELTGKSLKEFNKEVGTIDRLYGHWPEKIEGVDYNEMRFDKDLSLVRFSANIPIIGKGWNTRIDTILQLFDKDKNIIAEGSREVLGNGVVISSLTIYPSQILGLVERAPSRQLSNLTGIYDGKR